MFTTVTYNLQNLGLPEASPTSPTQYQKVVDVLREVLEDVPDARGVVVGVQEIVAPTLRAAGRVIKALARDTGMCCQALPTVDNQAVPAVARGRRGNGPAGLTFFVGLLWAGSMEPIPGTLRAYHDQMWHGLITAQFDVGLPQPLLVGSWHANPWCPDARLSEARRVSVPFTAPGLPGVLSSDTNMLAADPARDGSSYYDPDPSSYGDLDNPLLDCQVRWSDDGVPEADRRGAHVLLRRHLHDPAAVLDKPWQATCGHAPDPWGPRRIDTNRITPTLRPA
ncbi:hypothetical protein, partial [Streptomyces boncukensis]